MQPLRDYLNESPLQYESILDPNQSKIMGRMTDDVIRNRIREYCTYNYSKRQLGEGWLTAGSTLQITRVDKDEKGWYIETMSMTTFPLAHTNVKSYYEHCLSKGQKIDKQKGFLIKDIGVYFRWCRHKGALSIYDVPNFESTEGLPEKLDVLVCTDCCQKSNKLEVCNKINILDLTVGGDLEISGNGCKNAIIYPGSKTYSITAPSQTKILRPKTRKEYWDLRKKIM